MMYKKIIMKSLRKQKIENEYRWESVEIDKVREIHRHIKKLTLNKKSRLRKYMNDLLQNQYNTL